MAIVVSIFGFLACTAIPQQMFGSSQLLTTLN
jgi:hypothetical protein